MVHLKSFNYWYWGFLGLIVALFYVVNSFTPYFSDDWHYCMMIGANGEEDRWIENIGDVITSNYYHYFQVNGRFIPHFFLMTFDALLGKQWFNIFNAFLFGLYLHLLNLNFVKERKNALMGLAISVSLTLGFMCEFRNEFLWMSGVFNYEFVAVLVLFFNYLLSIEIHSKWLIPLLFLYGIICGWTNEAVVIGLCCVYLYVYQRKWRYLRWSQYTLLLGFAIGVVMCVFSPGSIHRALSNETSETVGISSMIFPFMKSLAYNLFVLKVFYFMLIIWLYIKHIKWVWLIGFFVSILLVGYVAYVSRYVHFAIESLSLIVLFGVIIMLRGCFYTMDIKREWLVGIIVSIFFVALTGHVSGHSRFGIELFSLIILLGIFPYEKTSNIIGVIMLSITAIYLLACMPFCILNYREYKDVGRQIRTTKDGIITTCRVPSSVYAERMILNFNKNEGRDYYSVYDEWYNPMLAHYYGRKDVKLYFLPEVFLRDIRDGRVNNTFDVDTRYPFYVCKLNEEDSVSSVKFVLGESLWASVPVVRTMKRFSAKEVLSDNWLVLKLYGGKYLLVKENPVIQERIIDIKYE